MTDEYETKLLAEDWAMALHIQEKCKFDDIISLLGIGLGDASSQDARDTYHDMLLGVVDLKNNMKALVRQTSEAAHMNPMSAERGEVCSKKKMGAVG